ncbi:MAG: GNAT family N-acetyltransferase [Galactobacter sp.]
MASSALAGSSDAAAHARAAQGTSDVTQTDDGLRVEPVSSFDQFVAADELYSRVFGYNARHLGLNANLLGAMVRNGGSAVGVYDGPQLVAFAYGFTGTSATGRIFHYSQAAVVDPAYQGQGLGRRIKTAQAKVAKSWGHQSMRWTFDPLLARNAHFNFSSLRADGLHYIHDYYGRPGTDRILVEWDLSGAPDPYERLRALPAPDLDEASWGRAVTSPGSLPDGGDATWIALPDSAVAGRDAASYPETRQRLRDTLTELLESRHRLVACQRSLPGTSAYLAVPSPPTVPSPQAVPSHQQGSA